MFAITTESTKKESTHGSNRNVCYFISCSSHCYQALSKLNLQTPAAACRTWTDFASPRPSSPPKGAGTSIILELRRFDFYFENTQEHRDRG